MVDDLVYLDAHPGVRTHPGDFLSDGGEAVQTTLLGVQVEKNWNDVRLMVSCAPQTAMMCATEHLSTLRCRQLVNDHYSCRLLMNTSAAIGRVPDPERILMIVALVSTGVRTHLVRLTGGSHLADYAAKGLGS